MANFINFDMKEVPDNLNEIFVRVTDTNRNELYSGVKAVNSTEVTVDLADNGSEGDSTLIYGDNYSTGKEDTFMSFSGHALIQFIADPVLFSGYKFQSNGTDNYIDLGFIPDDSTDLAFKVTYLSPEGTHITGSEEFGLGVVNGNLTSTVNGVSDTFESVSEETESLGLLSSGLAYLNGLERGTAASVSGATLNLIGMAKNSSSGVSDHCLAVWERISWYHGGEHYHIDFKEGSGNIVKDNFGNEYTIQGTVEDSQWVGYEKARRVLIDTDMETDCDDAAALRIAAWAEREGYIDIVALNMSNKTEGLSLAAGVDAIMTFEGRPNLAIGVNQRSTVITGGSSFNEAITQYPYTIYSDDTLVEDSISTYRRAVQSAIEDGVKIDIITIGTLRALSEFAQSLPSEGYSSGLDMISQGVGRIFCMGGDYPSGAEFNFNANSQAGLATEYILSTLEKEIIFTGATVGNEVVTGGNLKEDFPDLGVDIVRDAYYYHGSEDGRRSWDPMTLYLATLDNPSQVGQSLTRGDNSATETGSNTFTNSSEGSDYYATNLKISSYYSSPINKILAKTDWPSRNDIGKHSIPRISTILSLPKAELIQGDQEGKIVAEVGVVDNEVSGVSLGFSEGTNTEGYYSLEGSTVLLTDVGSSYLSLGGNRLPNLFITSSTGAKGYGQVRTIGTGDYEPYETEIGTGYLSLNEVIELSSGWEFNLTVKSVTGDLNILWPFGEDVPSNTLRLHLRGTTLTCSPEGNYSARLQIDIPTSDELNITVTSNVDGTVTLECNGLSVSKGWPTTVKYYIQDVGYDSATNFILDYFSFKGIANYNIYQRGLASFYFSEKGSINGYKYYNTDDDTDNTFFTGVGILPSDENPVN